MATPLGESSLFTDEGAQSGPDTAHGHMALGSC